MIRKPVVCLFLLVSLVVAQTAPAPAAPSQGMVNSEQFLERHGRAPEGRDYRAQVERLLQRMTVEEKVGQMTQLEIGMITDGKDQEIAINPQKLEKAVVQYGVGSILNVKDEALPVEKWHQIIGAIQQAAQKTRLKIPVIYGIDTIHGANYVRGSTLFPQPVAMAATWNPELMLRGSQIAAAETRAAGIPWNFSPVLDVGRHAAWPRLYETFGEDPYLASVMGVAAVRGYEGDDVSAPTAVASCMKHYIGYSFPFTGRDRTPALIPDSMMREIFVPPFAAAVKAGAKTVMVNSGDVNGVPGHVNRKLLVDLLRTELGFKGVVVSDWEDIKKMVTTHRAYATEKEATRAAVMAGIDMSMVPSDYSFADLLLQLVKEGAVPMTRINEAVRRILTLKYELGLFETPLPQPGPVGSEDSRAVSLRAAQEAITLLKNEKNVLPLKTGTRVLVVGPTADSLIPLNNGWTYHWQGDRANLYPNRPTVRQAFEAAAGAGNVVYHAGTTFDKDVDTAAAVSAAANVDAIVLALGEMSYTETPGNIEDMALPDAQLELATALAKTGKPVVLVLIEGRPRLIQRIADQMAAIVMAYNPSNEGGTAIAQVLFGEVNPSGKLPFTYPRYPNAMLTYDHRPYESSDTAFGMRAFQAQFEFGHGLSYTTFAYANLKTSGASTTPTGNVTVSVEVRNTGQRGGKEVVQLYVSDLAATITPPGKRLRRFAKVELQPGESKTVQFTLKPEDFSFVGADGKRVIEPGDFVISVGGLKAPLKMNAAPARRAVAANAAR